MADRAGLDGHGAIGRQDVSLDLDDKEYLHRIALALENISGVLSNIAAELDELNDNGAIKIVRVCTGQKLGRDGWDWVEKP